MSGSYPQYPGDYPPYSAPQSGPQWQYPYGPPGPYGPGGMPNYGPPPENHLVWGILTTILCCLPFGIVSIVKANQVNTLWAQGLPDQARQAADDAKKWAIWAAVALGIVIVLYLLVVVIIFGGIMVSVG